MKLKKWNLIFYLLGLITLPLIFIVFELFNSDKNKQDPLEGYKRVLIENYKKNSRDSTYTINGEDALIINDTQALANFRRFNRGFETTSSHDYTIDKKQFIGIDLSTFSDDTKRFYQNLIVESPALDTSISQFDQDAYLDLYRNFKPSGNCVSPNDRMKDNEYILEVNVEGTRLRLDKFEFGKFNYSNPGCFDSNSSSFRMKNVVQIDNINSKIPFYFRITTDGKENNSVKLNLELKSGNGKSLYKYPKDKKYFEETIKSLWGGTIVKDSLVIAKKIESIAKSN